MLNNQAVVGEVNKKRVYKLSPKWRKGWRKWFAFTVCFLLCLLDFIADVLQNTNHLMQSKITEMLGLVIWALIIGAGVFFAYSIFKFSIFVFYTIYTTL